MKYILTSILFVLLSYSLNGQIRAITDTGEEVLLNEDQTWEYVDGEKVDFDSIAVNPQMFKHDEKASFPVKSKKVDVSVLIDPKKWSFKGGENNEDAEYEFQLKDGDLFGMLITEQIEIPLATLRDIALTNGREVAPNLKIVEEEMRNVNSLEVLYLKMTGTLQGIDIAYIGYYYSNESGTTQFVTYTGLSLLPVYLEDIYGFLNGFVRSK